MSLLLDAVRSAGVDALAQSRLGSRPRPQVPLTDLGEAAYATLAVTTARIYGAEDLDERAPGPLLLPLLGRFELRRVAIEERPSLNSL